MFNLTTHGCGLTASNAISQQASEFRSVNEASGEEGMLCVQELPGDQLHIHQV